VARCVNSKAMSPWFSPNDVNVTDESRDEPDERIVGTRIKWAEIVADPVPMEFRTEEDTEIRRRVVEVGVCFAARWCASQV